MEELDKYLRGSSYELGLYISNQVLRGEVKRLRDELVKERAKVERYKRLCGEGVYKTHGWRYISGGEGL